MYFDWTLHNMSSKALLFILCVIGVNSEQTILKLHNEKRALHKVPPLKWSNQAAEKAKQWADRCVFAHSNNKNYGENLASGHQNWDEVMRDWYDKEIVHYNYNYPGFSMQTGHFTQIVWKSTKKVGCAMSPCGGRPLYVCKYWPPGNRSGRFINGVNRYTYNIPKPTTKAKKQTNNAWWQSSWFG